VRAADIDVCVEFTRAEAIPQLAPALAKLGRPWVSGTTGLDEAGRAALETAAKAIPVLWSPNMSLGVTLLLRLLEQTARFLPPDWEMEIVETHHAAKRDAPSGTALALAASWRAARGGELRCGRSGPIGPRPAAEIGIHAVRLPEGIGEHRVLLGSRSEIVELVHRATERAAFARGALEAARWLAGQKKAGLYTLADWADDRLRETAR
jgi:4-hydroxy-tetrahydrodipicolinate reductase